MDRLAILGELLPVLAAIRVGRRLSWPSRLVAIVFGLWFVEDLFEEFTARLSINNNWLQHLTLPIETGLLLWAFSLWQEREVSRRAMRLAIPLYGVVWLVLQLFVERFDRLSQYAGPMSYLLIIAVAAFTLVTKPLGTVAPVWREPWFWISAGMIIDFGSQVALNPISNILIARHEQGHAIYQSFGAVGIVSYLLTTWGILCERLRPSFGGFSSLPPWQPESSPPPS